MIHSGQLKHKFFRISGSDKYGNPVSTMDTTSAPTLRIEFINQDVASRHVNGGIFDANAVFARCRYTRNIQFDDILINTRDPNDKFLIRGIENVGRANREMILTLEARR